MQNRKSPADGASLLPGPPSLPSLPAHAGATGRSKPGQQHNPWTRPPLARPRLKLLYCSMLLREFPPLRSQPSSPQTLTQAPGRGPPLRRVGGHSDALRGPMGGLEPPRNPGSDRHRGCSARKVPWVQSCPRQGDGPGIPAEWARLPAGEASTGSSCGASGGFLEPLWPSQAPLPSLQSTPSLVRPSLSALQAGPSEAPPTTPCPQVLREGLRLSPLLPLSPEPACSTSSRRAPGECAKVPGTPVPGQEMHSAWTCCLQALLAGPHWQPPFSWNGTCRNPFPARGLRL